MRQRELLAPKRQGADLENSYLSVRPSVSEGRIPLGEPKTEESRRTVQLNEAAVQALRAHLARWIGQVERLVDLYGDQGLVFASKLRSPTNPTNARARVRMGGIHFVSRDQEVLPYG